MTVMSDVSAKCVSYVEFWSSHAVFYVLRAAHPDGSDIVWPIEVDDSNGTLRYRYPFGPPPFGIDLTNSSGNSSNGVGDADRQRRAATTYRNSLWPGGIVPYEISSDFTGTNEILRYVQLVFSYVYIARQDSFAGEPTCLDRVTNLCVKSNAATTAESSRPVIC